MRMTQKQLDRIVANGGRIVSTVGGGKALHSRSNSVSVPIAATPAVEPLPLATGPACFRFPEYRLRSWNTMLGSGRKGPQALSKQEAKAAVEAASSLLRFEGACSLLIVQVHPGETRRWDIDGLCAKHLIDALVRRGCWPDDNREVLTSITLTHRVGDLAVEIHVTPKEVAA